MGVAQEASAEPGGNFPNRVCKEFNDFPGFFANHGECIDFFNSNGRDSNELCRETFWGDFFGNHGQCVSALTRFL